jgi:hypothetical protein
MDADEIRKLKPVLTRYLILTSVSYLFLARVRKRLRGKKSRPDGMPNACCGCGVSAELVA